MQHKSKYSVSYADQPCLRSAQGDLTSINTSGSWRCWHTGPCNVDCAWLSVLPNPERKQWQQHRITDTELAVLSSVLGRETHQYWQWLRLSHLCLKAFVFAIRILQTITRQGNILPKWIYCLWFVALLQSNQSNTVACPVNRQLGSRKSMLRALKLVFA